MFQQVFAPIDGTHLEIIGLRPFGLAFHLVAAVEDFIHFNGVILLQKNGPIECVAPRRRTINVMGGPVG